MATLIEQGNPSNRFSFPILETYEFIPIVQFKKPSKYVVEGEELISSDEQVSLAKYIDDDKRNLNILQLTTSKKKIKLPFRVKQGGSASWDDDGFIEPQLSIKDANFKVISTTKILTKYNSDIEVELSLEGTESTSFYLDFYANDNEDLFKGGIKNIFCGRVKIVFNYCVCTDWATIPSVIPSNKFIGWGHPGITRNCYHYCLEQLKQVGHWVKSERWNKKWDGTKELNDNIYQIFLEADVAGMTKGIQKDQFKKGVEYLKKTIKKGIPVMVGVDDDIKLSNDDETTEHFVVIVGMGTDTTGNYFLFYDNAVPDKYVGTHNDNKLYCKCNDFKLEGTGSHLNIYIQMNTSKKKYTVTQIRETK